MDVPDVSTGRGGDGMKPKPLLALLVAGCAFMVVAVAALWAWQAGAPFVLGGGRIDGAGPPADFVVVLHEPASGYRYLRWERLREIEADGATRTFLLPEAKGGDATKLSDRQTFAVLEDHGDRQIVEVNVLGAHQTWSRYEAYRDRVVPVAFRTDGGPFFAGLLGFVVLAAAAWIAKRVYWLVANRIGAHVASGERR